MTISAIRLAEMATWIIGNPSPKHQLADLANDLGVVSNRAAARALKAPAGTKGVGP
jgi:hypothetical protein